MLSDTKLKNLKPQEKPFKVTDRDGLYVMVLPSGSISFRYNYKINGRYETLTIGKYGNISLAEARELLVAAKKSISTGSSPARVKAREKKRLVEADTFGEWAEMWLTKYAMADSTRDMKRSGVAVH